MSGDTTVTDSSTLSSLASPAPATSTSWQNEVCKGPHHDFNSSFLRHNSGQGIGKLQKYRLSSLNFIKHSLYSNLLINAKYLLMS